MLSSDSDVVERIENLLPHGSGINGRYYMHGMAMLPPDDDYYIINLSNTFEEIENDRYERSHLFGVVYTYDTKRDKLIFEYISTNSLDWNIEDYLEELFSEVAKEYNKLYCNVEDNQKQENYGE